MLNYSPGLMSVICQLRDAPSLGVTGGVLSGVCCYLVVNGSQGDRKPVPWGTQPHGVLVDEFVIRRVDDDSQIFLTSCLCDQAFIPWFSLSPAFCALCKF